MFSVSHKLTSIFTDIANIIRTKMNTNYLIYPYEIIDILDNCQEDQLALLITKQISKIISFQTLGCTKIITGMFQSCNLLSEAYFPEVKTISPYAFKDCQNLSQIYIPSCTTIYTEAFANCLSLNTIYLPKCTNIQTSAFTNCQLLTSLYLGSEFCSLGSSASYIFNSTPIYNYNSQNGKIFVPSSLLTTYKNNANWKLLSNHIYSI